jgi:hypothetical protein
MAGREWRRPALLSALVYVVATIWMGHRVIQSLGTNIASDPGDPLLTAAILAWNASHIAGSDAWFQFPIFHPTANVLTFSEHMLGISLFASPVYWITGNPVAAYNVTLLLAYPLSGLAMYAMVWKLTHQPGAAFLAGLAFAFAPYRVSHLPHLHVQMVFWAPLALLGLHQFVAQTSRRGWWLALFAVCWMLQGASNGYFLVYFSVLVGMWILWFVVARRRWRDLGWIGLAMGVACLPLVPILYRYIVSQRELGLSRNLGEISLYGADIASVLCGGFRLTFWGWLNVACGPEGELFVGAALLAILIWARWANGADVDRASEAGRAGRASEAGGALVIVRRSAIAASLLFMTIGAITAIVGPWRVDLGWLRASASSAVKPLSTALAMMLLAFLLSPTFHRAVRRGSATTFYVGAALTCWVLAWGPFPRLFGVDAIYQAPFAWLLQIPGISGLRVPARFWMMSVVCLCVLLGLVTARVLARSTARRALAIVGVAAIGLLIDGWTTIPVAAPPAGVPNPAALRDRVVMHLPIGALDPDIPATYRAVMGGWRSINGYSGYEPGYYDALRALSRDRDAVLFDPFVEREDVHVLLEESAADLRAMLERQPGVEMTARGGGLLQYRIPRRAAADREDGRLGNLIEPGAISSSCDEQGLAFATDGDLDTSWVCGPQSADQQISVEFRAPLTVGAVVLQFGPRGSGFPRELVVETSNDGLEWQVAWEGSLAAGVLRAALESPAETRVEVRFAPRDARRIRLRQVGRDDRFWSIAELSLWSGVK